MDIFDLSIEQRDSGIKPSGSKHIDVYNTHIEVYPYKKGECFDLEKTLSTYIFTRRIYKPFAFKINNNVLFLPKGINVGALELKFRSRACYHKDSDPYEKFKIPIHLRTSPRDEIQEKSIDFLTSTGDFRFYRNNTQYILNLKTGYGKSYCAIAAMTFFKIKTIIFIHRNQLEVQWLNYIKEYTDVKDDRICILKSATQLDQMLDGKLDYDIYISSHQIMTMYGNKNGWDKIRDIFKKSNIGLKIFDESHLYIENLMSIDFNSNTFLTYYLSATMERSDKKENSIVKIVFGSAFKWGSRISSINQNLIYVPIIYNSHATEYENFWIRKNGIFSSFRYIDYALKSNSSFYLINALHFVLEDIKRRGIYGQVLIVTPRIDTVEIIEKLLKENVEDPENVKCIYSKNSHDENIENASAKWISSTIKSTGVGFSPPNLQCLVCLEPVSSSILFKQLAGRLDRFIPGEKTYFYDLVDISLDDVTKNYNNTHLSHMRNVAKEVDVINLEGVT